MDKWRDLKNSAVIRIAGSATTLVGIAALSGAGWKWG